MYRRGPLVLALLLLLLVVSLPQVSSTRFYLASWDFPDEYGQGIYYCRIYENSTASWLEVDGSPVFYYDNGVFEWNASIGIKLSVTTRFNYTLTGVGSLSEGQLYQRHNVTVRDSFGNMIFNQANFTYFSGVEYGGLYVYTYNVVLDFLPLYGESYAATITYEVFW